MMVTDISDQDTQQFVSVLFEKTGGNAQKQVSMYDIGESIGLDRASSSRVAESLMTSGMIEIRTLSGGIGLTPEGASEAQSHLNPKRVATQTRLGSGPVIQQPEREALEHVLSVIKSRIGKLGLDYATLTDIMADIRSMESQLLSSRAKTIIFRECLTSVDVILKPHDSGEIRNELKFLLT